MSTNSIEIKHLILLGAIAVGKGFTTKYVKTVFDESDEDVFIHGMGDLVRNRMKNDCTFRSRVGQYVENGSLVPDTEVTSLALHEYRRAVEARCKHILWEGFFRNDAQVFWALDRKIISEKDTVVIDLIAEKATLKARHQHRLSAKVDGDRFDEHKFDERVLLHQVNNPFVLQEFARAGIRIKQVDADHDLPLVAKVVARHAKEHWKLDVGRAHLEGVPETLDLPPWKKFRIAQERSAFQEPIFCSSM